MGLKRRKFIHVDAWHDRWIDVLGLGDGHATIHLQNREPSRK